MGSGRPFGSFLSRPAAALVCSCPFPLAWSPGGSPAPLGPLLGLSRGPFWASWRPGSWRLLGLSWAAPGPSGSWPPLGLLERFWRPSEPKQNTLERLLGGPREISRPLSAEKGPKIGPPKFLWSPLFAVPSWGPKRDPYFSIFQKRFSISRNHFSIFQKHFEGFPRAFSCRNDMQAACKYSLHLPASGLNLQA